MGRGKACAPSPPPMKPDSFAARGVRPFPILFGGFCAAQGARPMRRSRQPCREGDILRGMVLEITGRIWHWRGPAPFYFVTVPEKEASEIKAVESLVTYGWGMIPAMVRIGRTEFKTALWPKVGAYIVPIKASVRRAEGLHEGDEVGVRLEI